MAQTRADQNRAWLKTAPIKTVHGSKPRLSKPQGPTVRALGDP